RWLGWRRFRRRWWFRRRWRRLRWRRRLGGMVMTLLSAAGQQAVADAITAVERETDAELVTVVARRADDYSYIPTLWAAAVALLTPGALASQWLTLPWLTLWDVLLVQWLIFAALALALRWPPL